jgi:hypothetical protein
VIIPRVAAQSPTPGITLFLCCVWFSALGAVGSFCRMGIPV